MKLKLLAIACAFPLIAADPAGFAYWSSSDIKSMSSKLAAKGGKFASQQLDKFGNHYAMLAHREANGEAELHETEADLFVVESGNATLIVGGKMHDAKTTAPHELRGPSIEGGEKKALSAGDIVHIPANTPHQLILDGSHEFTYFVMKVGGQ